ncbi:MAG: hypothetical protein ACE5KG_01085 [Nitrososphaerales archaeon]
MRSRRKRGQSEIISSLLLITSAVALGSVVFFWGLSFAGGTQSSLGGAIFQENSKVGEHFRIETIYFNTSPEELTIYVRNYGIGSITISGVFINDVLANVTTTLIGGRESTNSTAPITVTFDFDPGETYIIKVSTLRGNTFQNHFRSPDS